MKFVPWQSIADWKCNTCGDCCRLYSVVLGFPEWLRIVKYFGVEKTAAGLDKLYIKRCSDGSCPFMCNFVGAHYCGLQSMKPDACKLWPFKVLSEPKFGNANHALYSQFGRRLFVYADSMCSGLRYGSPQRDFTSTIKEFVELALGIRQTQCKTTSSLISPQLNRFRNRLSFC
jgi:Fe-S-cluster containining protein